MGDRGQGGPDQLLGAGKVGILVCLNWTPEFESIQLLPHDQCLGLLEVKALVLKFLCFSRPSVEKNDSVRKYAFRARES